MEPWHYMPWYGMIFGPLMMILVLVTVIVAVVFVVRWLGGGPWSGSASASPPLLPENRALNILKERYARGEIDREEFEERRRVLGE